MAAITEQDVLSALKSCYDPEIPVNIVDLGLIYNVNFAPVPAQQSRRIEAGRHRRNDPDRARLPRARQHQRAGQITRRAVARRQQLHRECRVDSALDPRTSQPRRQKATRYRVRRNRLDVGPQTSASARSLAYSSRSRRSRLCGNRRSRSSPISSHDSAPPRPAASVIRLPACPAISITRMPRSK